MFRHVNVLSIFMFCNIGKCKLPGLARDQNHAMFVLFFYAVTDKFHAY